MSVWKTYAQKNKLFIDLPNGKGYDCSPRNLSRQFDYFTAAQHFHV